MSNPQNHNPLPPEPQGSKKPDSNQPEGKMNWKVLILFSVAIGVIFMAFHTARNTGVEKLTLPEFNRALIENRVLREAPEKLGQQAQLQFVTFKGEAYRAEIHGLYSKDKPFVTDWENTTAFSVPVNALVMRDEISTLFGDRIEWKNEEQPAQTSEEITFAQLKDLLGKNKIALPANTNLTAYYTEDNVAVITGMKGTPQYPDIKTLQIDQKEKTVAPFLVKANTILQQEQLSKILDGNIKTREESNMMGSIFFSLLPIFLIVLILIFLFRHQMKSAGRGAMNFGKSKARLLSMDRNKVTFDDVAGIQEAKEELWEIVDYLRDPRKFQCLGGSIPKGVLMVGAPGTGKTLLARAIAGEADVPFFSISGSDFVEMFVGVGASRVRDMFEQGKKNAPCLVFIDEIDAVGRHRGHGMGGGHDEREQTLNALLVEMDGFETQEGVIIIAATNRPDVLDPALLRPGRFDRQVTVSLPDVKGREQILKVHVKKIKLAPETDLAVVARGTPGFSGAELANLINESALLAARKGKKEVGLEEMEEARDKVRWGRERRSLALSEKEKKNTAYHEAGHAILNVILEHTDPLHKVTIIPRGPSLGSTMFLPEEDKFNYRKNEIIDQLIVLMGGRVAEEIVFGDVTNGAMGDIRMATNLARKMVCEWGMSEQLGMVEYGDGDGEVFLARDIAKSKNYSEDTAQKIDGEIKRFIDTAYGRAKQLLLENRDKLDLISLALLEYETLDANHVNDLMQNGEMKDPPEAPKPPEAPDDIEPEKVAEPKKESREDDGDPLAGEPGGQLTTTTEVENYPGFPEGIMGPELMGNMQKQAEKFGARVEYKTVDQIIRNDDGTFTLKCGGDEIQSKTVIIATGAAPRHLGLPNEKELIGHGLDFLRHL
nr:ATP-dependent zinc metalloprotease FtsH 2-like [Nerophis lumbriciformis]